MDYPVIITKENCEKKLRKGARMAIENYMPDFAVEAVYDLTVPSLQAQGIKAVFGRFGQYPHCLEQP